MNRSDVCNGSFYRYICLLWTPLTSFPVAKTHCQPWHPEMEVKWCDDRDGTASLDGLVGNHLSSLHGSLLHNKYWIMEN